jgi:hypothetical protein
MRDEGEGRTEREEGEMRKEGEKSGDGKRRRGEKEIREEGERKKS